MTTVNMHQAKTHLSRLVDEAVSGKEVVIAKAGRPMVRLVPVERREGPRTPGALAGRVREIDPGWWGPDADLEALFYGVSETDPLEDRGSDG
jgi:prevent-host-death family protein